MPWTDYISSEDLAAYLADPGWVVVDCRFDMANPDWGFNEYQRSHIPGAVYANIDRDLAGPKTAVTGRHPLPEPETFIQTLSSWGIEAGKQVVAYDNSDGSFSDRLWWMLHLFGHQSAAVLDGGFQKWVAEGRPTRSGVEKNPPGHFIGTLHREMMADEAEVERIRQDPAWKLIDARTSERYRGEVELIDPVAGHIPGAINRPYGLNLDSGGTIKLADQLRHEFEQLLGDTSPDRVVVYCGSGVTATHHILAMEHAGLKGARVYVGSWSQWIRDPNRPRTEGNG